MRTKLFFVLLLLFVVNSTYAQNTFSGFNYQSQLYTISGQPDANKNFNLKFEIRYNSITGLLLYDEQQIVSTNVRGYFNAMIGQGTPLSNGIYSLIDNINWKDTSYFVLMYRYDSTLTTYNLMAAHSLMSIPFALVSKNTLQKYTLNELTDVDTTGLITGSILRWNGIKWIVSIDSLATQDTVAYAVNSTNSVYSDTSNFAYNAQNIIPSDTAIFAYTSDTSNYALNSNTANYADSTSYSDTATVALYAAGTWRTTGNSGTNSATDFLGTTDAKDIRFVTNNISRMTVTSAGRIGIGTTSPLTDFHVDANNGVLFSGTLGAGTIPTTGGGTRFMWYPKKSALRGGTLDGIYTTYWNDALIGNYSFAYGYNVKAQGIASVAMGDRAQAIGAYSTVFGSQVVANSGATYAFVAGQGSTANGSSSVALGRGNTANGFASSAIGYHCTTNGDYSQSHGYYCTTNADYTLSMGYQARANHIGSFIYTDYSNAAAIVTTTANNQFFVRAAGGFVFYTSSTLTSGSVLAAGSGSWATLSDSSAKRNINEINYQSILNKIENTKVYTWEYKTQKGVTHIGPMAQDFKRKFSLGENETTISTVDIDGVNMAAIKALQIENEKLKKQISELDYYKLEYNKLIEEREKFLKKLKYIEENLTKHNLIGENK